VDVPKGEMAEWSWKTKGKLMVMSKTSNILLWHFKDREINSGGKNYDISVLLKDPKVCF
jgi:hypothetical protein